jgi:hypothetical protein
MSDLYLFGVVAGVVAVVAFVLYVWDKTSKGQPIEWLDAGKLALGSGGVAGGVAYAFGTEVGAEAAVETATTVAQEMFVGKAEF